MGLGVLCCSTLILAKGKSFYQPFPLLVTACEV